MSIMYLIEITAALGRTTEAGNFVLLDREMVICPARRTLEGDSNDEEQNTHHR